MVYRGIYRDGVVILQDNVALSEGDVVEVVRSDDGRGPKPGKTVKPRAKTKKKSKRSVVRGSPAAPRTRRQIEDSRAMFGMWKDRPDWKGRTTLDIAAELRRKALGRFGNR